MAPSHLQYFTEKICWENLLRRSAEKDLLKTIWWEDQDGRPPCRGTALSDFRICGEMRIFEIAAKPSRHFVVVGLPKLRWNANFATRRRNPLITPWLPILSTVNPFVTSGQMSETVVKWWFLYGAECRGRPALDSCIFVHATVAKPTFWNFGWHALVARRTFWFCRMNPLVGFGGSIARKCGEIRILSSRNCSAHWPGVVSD